MRQLTTLFSLPRLSFWDGLARLLDLGSTLVVDIDDLRGNEADALAMLSDWQVTGQDLEWAMLHLATDPRDPLNISGPFGE